MKRFNWYLLPPMCATCVMMIWSIFIFRFSESNWHLTVMVITIVAFITTIINIPINIKSWLKKRKFEEKKSENDMSSTSGIMGGNKYADLVVAIIIIISGTLALVSFIRFYLF